MDGVTAHVLAEELNDLLAGAIIERIAMLDRHTVSIALFTPARQKRHLTLGSNPSEPTLTVTRSALRETTDRPPPLCMYLRKHLRRARLVSIATPPWERVFVMTFDATDDIGDHQTLRLIFECMPRTANLVVVNDDDIILAALRHIDHSVNRVRETLPAHPYIPPPPQRREAPTEILKMDATELREAFRPDGNVRRGVTAAVAGFSPVLADAVVFNADLSGDRAIASLDDAAWTRLDRSLRAMCRAIVHGPERPAIYYDRPTDDPQRRPVAVHVVDLAHLSHRTPYERVADAVTAYHRIVDRDTRFERHKASLTRVIEQRMRHAQRKREHHEADVAEGQTAAEDRRRGELLLAFMHMIPEGASVATVPDYYHDNRSVDIEIDPARSVPQNADRFYEAAKKRERKLEAANRLLNKDLRTLAWLESLSVAVACAETHEDLDLLEDELGVSERERQHEETTSTVHAPGLPASKKRRTQKAFAKPDRRQNPTKRPAADTAIGPRRFTSSDGFTVVCGRNNVQNDQLVRKARKDDLWFHRKGAPGAHVIVETDGRDVPAQTLYEAAGIAAWYSSVGALAGAIEIDYCRIRDVKKSPGTPPGHVYYNAFKTLYVEPLDPRSLLRERGEDEVPRT